jgi:hypothetical protein
MAKRVDWNIAALNGPRLEASVCRQEALLACAWESLLRTQSHGRRTSKDQRRLSSHQKEAHAWEGGSAVADSRFSFVAASEAGTVVKVCAVD